MTWRDTDHKKRIHQRETICIAHGAAGMTEQKVREFIADGYDLLFIDAQHQPVDEKELAALCRTAGAAGLPVVLRVRHPDDAFLAGRYLDFGLLGIVVPMVERPETVLRAIEAFYYPPLGRRSWGPGNAYGWGEFAEGFSYAEWWNTHGVLMVQFESIPAIVSARELVKPGVDMVVFGECDLTLDLSARSDSPFKTFDECVQHVVKATESMDVKIGVGSSPLGRL